MSFLPDIIDGKLADEAKQPKLFTPKIGVHFKREEALIEDERLSALNNYGREATTKDFADAPVLRERHYAHKSSRV